MRYQTVQCAHACIYRNRLWMSALQMKERIVTVTVKDKGNLCPLCRLQSCVMNELAQ